MFFLPGPDLTPYYLCIGKKHVFPQNKEVFRKYKKTPSLSYVRIKSIKYNANFPQKKNGHIRSKIRFFLRVGTGKKVSGSSPLTQTRDIKFVTPFLALKTFRISNEVE